MMIRSLAYGLTAHLIIGWAFFFFIPAQKPRKLPPQVPVQIHIAAKPVRPVVRRLTASGPGSTAASQSKSNASSSTEPPKSPPGSLQRYSDLLPMAINGQISLPKTEAQSERSLLPGHQFKEGSSGSTKQQLVIDASVLSGAFDVPLKARRISSGAEAFLRVIRSGREGLRIVELRGDPMLRAVIFENLHQPKVAALILGLMDELQENSLPITLQTLLGEGSRMQDEADFTWIGRKLVIRKSAPPEWKAPTGAIALPDEEAKKAVIKDRLDFERFQESRAYRSAIHNYELPLP